MNRKFRLAFVATALAAVGGCTAVTVQPVSNLAEILHVCIRENPKVRVSDFVSVLETGFERYGISTELIQSSTPPHCEYVLTYSALRSWDMAPYLSQADMQLTRSGRRIASAEYRLRGKGGLALNKRAGTETKISPVIEELLTGRE